MDYGTSHRAYERWLIMTNQNQIAAKTRPKAGVRRFDFDEEGVPFHIIYKVRLPFHVMLYVWRDDFMYRVSCILYYTCMFMIINIFSKLFLVLLNDILL